ncbi:MAG: amino acid kinase family protein, partial [Candidatus Nitrosocosmicus sp.]
MKIIMKFGGSVLDSPSKLDTVVKILKSFKKFNGEKNDIICVISAMARVTDKILSLVDLLLKGDRDALNLFVDEMTYIHIDLIEKTITNNILQSEAKHIVLG